MLPRTCRLLTERNHQSLRPLVWIGVLLVLECFFVKRMQYYLFPLTRKCSGEKKGVQSYKNTNDAMREKAFKLLLQ